MTSAGASKWSSGRRRRQRPLLSRILEYLAWLWLLCSCCPANLPMMITPTQTTWVSDTSRHVIVMAFEYNFRTKSPAVMASRYLRRRSRIFIGRKQNRRVQPPSTKPRTILLNSLKKQTDLGQRNGEERLSLLSTKNRLASGMFFITVASFVLNAIFRRSPSVAHAAATSVGSISSSDAATLGYFRTLIPASLMLASFGVIPLYKSKFVMLSKSLLKSAGRCAVQVSFLGSILLQRILGVTNPSWVLAWVFGIGILAGREATSRIQYTYPNMERNMYVSVLAGVLTVLVLTHILGILTPNPWYDPRTWISIAGMLFGNTLNASALAGASITKQFATNSNIVELRLARGATTTEAIRPLVEESYGTSLTPTINSLAATGVIHIPGMMTGQILAGQSPQQAALYQIMINFLIASTAVMTVQLVVKTTIAALVCQRGNRLRSGSLQIKASTQNSSGNKLLKRLDFSTVKSVFFSLLRRTNLHQNNPNADIETQERVIERDIEIKSTVQDEVNLEFSKCKTGFENDDSTCRDDNLLPAAVLEIRKLFVSRPNVTIDLTVHEGDRIGISGKSGIGKSQILRSIVGLEEMSFSNDGIEERGGLFMNEPVDLNDLPTYRRSVCLVPQMAPSMEGTPQEFFNQVLQFKTQQTTSTFQRRLEEKISSWDLETAILHQPWSALSGGQSQRVQLAIALALSPKILLLDESLNALDSKTSQLVETTLIDCGIPVIIVTHSEEQKKRFCTHELSLS